MAKLVVYFRLMAGALALAFLVAMSAPVSAQQPNSVDPNAAAVKEQQLLQQLKYNSGSRHYSRREILRPRTSGRPRMA